MGCVGDAGGGQWPQTPPTAATCPRPPACYTLLNFYCMQAGGGLRLDTTATKKKQKKKQMSENIKTGWCTHMVQLDVRSKPSHASSVLSRGLFHYTDFSKVLVLCSLCSNNEKKIKYGQYTYASFKQSMSL